MAFEYGSIDLGIRNPFKVEGMIRAIQGLIVVGLGASALFQVKHLTLVGGTVVALPALAVGAVLIFIGGYFLGGGLLNMLRFFVGRGVPTSLADNGAKSEAHMREHVKYDGQKLAQMLQGRKILIEIDPGANPLSRLVCTLAESVLYLPEKYYNTAMIVAQALVQSLAVAVLFAFAGFLGYTGLVPVMSGPVLGWTGVVMVLYLLRLWLKARIIPPRIVEIGWKWAVWPLGLTGVTYAGLLWASFNSVSLSPVPPTVWVMLGGIALLGVVTMGLVIAQIRARAQMTTPETEVSEYRTNWQESIHPAEVFINFESIVMANRRYKEMPNRVYRAFDPSLLEQGSAKGGFDGETIQETQPVCRMVEAHPAYQWIRIGASAVGHGLIVLAAVLVYAGLGIVSTASGRLAGASYWAELLPFFAGGFILYAFGRTITEHARWFWSEVQFESLLIYFQCRGTYTESRLTTGKSVYDSTQSDNLVYRSSLTPWVVATRVVTSWFASSAKGIEPRYVLEMHKADADLNAIMAELKQFITARAGLTALETERDVAAVAQIAEINRQTRIATAASIPQPVATSPLEHTQGSPLAVGSPASLERPQIGSQ